MSSHPGSTLESAIMLAEYFRDSGHMPEQVQDFYPTPGTLSTTMFYTGLDPRTMKPVYVPKTKHEKAMQRALLQYRNPKKYDLVYEALVEGGREDLIGYGPKCLIKPREAYYKSGRGYKKENKSLQSNKAKVGKGRKESSSKSVKNKVDTKSYSKMNQKAGQRRDIKHSSHKIVGKQINKK